MPLLGGVFWANQSMELEDDLHDEMTFMIVQMFSPYKAGHDRMALLIRSPPSSSNIYANNMYDRRCNK